MGSIQICFSIVYVFSWVPLSLGGIANTAENLSTGLKFRRLEKKAKRRRPKSNGRKPQRTISGLNIVQTVVFFLGHYITDFKFQFTPSCSTVQKISNPPASFHLFPWLRTMGPSLASVTLAGWLQWHAEQRLRMVLVQLRLLRRCLNTDWVIFQAITTMTNILTFGILPGQNEIYIYIIILSVGCYLVTW